MAANSKSVQGIASVGKQFVRKIRSHDHTPSLSAFIVRRSAHTSVYDKNLDDQVRSAAVPDEVIEPESDKYWAPHPKTGVFGPVTDHNTNSNADVAGSSSEDSVLGETAWFRPTSLEDLEKSSQS